MFNQNTAYTSLTKAMIYDLRNQMPEILAILLKDRTTSTPTKVRNIIWANDNHYANNNTAYNAAAQIKIEQISGDNDSQIKPRAHKTAMQQKNRTKSQAEVFTPTWIVKKQNDTIDQNFADDDMETYINRKWLEISCGEAPYMATRYDMETGETIEISARVGFVDRKMRRINSEVSDKAEWQRLTELAYKSSYGFEWSGDSLLLARENLFYTYCDYYIERWHETPFYGLLLEIAKIISYNIFQMDGLTYTIPLSENKKLIENPQLGLFDDNSNEPAQWEVIPGKRVKVMNWEINKMEYFDKGIK